MIQHSPMITNAWKDISAIVLVNPEWRDSLCKSRETAIELLSGGNGSEYWRQFAFEGVLEINAYGI